MSSIFLGYFIYSYFMQTLNNATPRMAADLKGMSLYSWSVSIPSLGLALGTLLAGKLSDIFGRRIVLLVSMIIALLGTILSAISPTFITLIAARTLLFLGLGTVDGFDLRSFFIAVVGAVLLLAGYRAVSGNKAA